MDMSLSLSLFNDFYVSVLGGEMEILAVTHFIFTLEFYCTLFYKMDIKLGK